MTLEGKPIIVWMDNGAYENWTPREFETTEEALKFILSGDAWGPIVVTQRILLEVTGLAE